MSELRCIYCGKTVELNDRFLNTFNVDEKKELVVKCGDCLKLPYHKRPNLKEAEETRRRFRL